MMRRLSRLVRDAIMLAFFLQLLQIYGFVSEAAIIKDLEMEVYHQRPTSVEPTNRSRKLVWPWWKNSDFQTTEATSLVVVGSTEKDKKIVLNNNTHKKKRAKTKKRPKSETQKLANCRLLANHSNKSRLSRLWKQIYKRRNAVDMNVAYEMAIMASLSYRDFHKKNTPTSFEIMSNSTGTLKPLRKRQSKLAKTSSIIVSSLRLALDQALPWRLLIPSRRQRLSKGTRKRRSTNHHNNEHKQRSEKQKKKSRSDRHRVQLEYSFYNWYEPTPLGNFHDTDLLLATSNNGRTLIVAFAGTQSVTDSFTNLQTFESARHSNFFSFSGTNTTANSKTEENSFLQGSIHRGFLNAYTRTERGKVLRLCADSNCTLQPDAFSSLYHRYGHCTVDGRGTEKSLNTTTGKEEDKVTSSNGYTANNVRDETIQWKRGLGCKVKHRKLMTILRDLVTDYLSSGKTVHLTGHSLGGSIATLLALDIILNFPRVPVKNLELWTFGGAQVADDAFLESALQVAPRLKDFLQQEPQSQQPQSSTSRGSSSIVGRLLKKASKEMAACCSFSTAKSRFHRFVTVSDDCQVDFVSTVAQKTLAPDNYRNFHGKTARKIGGVQGSRVVHLTDPYYLLTPDQYELSATKDQRRPKNNDDDNDFKEQERSSRISMKKTVEKETPSVRENKAASSNASSKQPSSTRSSLAAHACSNYLQGISRESIDHPLTTDFPGDVRQFLGEMIV